MERIGHALKTLVEISREALFGSSSGEREEVPRKRQRESEASEISTLVTKKARKSDADSKVSEESKKKSKKKKSKKKLNLNYLTQPGDSSRVWPKRLLVVDLNGFMIHRSKKKVPGLNVNRRDPFGYFVYDRPHCREFLKWCRSRGFQLAIWTSATPPVAQAIADHLMTGKLDRDSDLCFVWDQTRCERRKTNSSTAPVFSKNLEAVWTDDELGKSFNATNSMIVDNSLEKTQAQTRNRILVKSFDPATYDAEKDELAQNGKLWKYLDALSRFQGDVREFIDARPYDRDACEAAVENE